MKQKSKLKLEKPKKSFSLRIMKTYLTLALMGFWCVFSATNLYSQSANVALSTSSVSGVAQNPTITASGVVTDPEGETLIGVSVVQKDNLSNGTTTDANGKFTLVVPAGSSLEISYVGFKTQTVRAGQNLSITLVENTTFDDVVVVGYGTQKKVNLTGSVTSVDAKELIDRPNTNILNTIQGRVAGVNIVSRPGGTPAINMRGRGNLGSSTPLYVIDGVIADGTMFGRLDPNSIESVNFLKDAASSAIYGSRAAYGVVLVTTKQGKAGKIQVDYNGYAGFKHQNYRPKVLDGGWYVALREEARYNDGIRKDKPDVNALRQEYLDKHYADPDMYGNTDWYEEALDNDVAITQHSLSFRGGSDNVRFSTTVGYTFEDSFTPHENTNRYNLASNLAVDAAKWLTFRTDIKYIKNDRKRRGSPSYMNMIVMPTTMVAKQSTGQYGSRDNGALAGVDDITGNPLRNLEQGGWERENQSTANINLGVDFKPIENLVLTGEVNYYSHNSKKRTYENSWDQVLSYPEGTPIGKTERANKMTYDWGETDRTNYDARANYSLQVADKHNMSFLAGASYEHRRYNRLQAARKNFTNNEIPDLNGGTESAEFDGLGNAGGSNNDRLVSYFGRLTYNFSEKYLFEFNMRADGSSRFAKENRWGYFPSVSAGWRISEESFMKDVSWIYNMKLRASWGQLGNIYNVGHYDYFSTYNQGGNYNFDNTLAPGFYPGKPANPDLGWETVTMTDIGLDFDVLGGKGGLVVDWYHKKTTDILVEYEAPRELGLSNKLSGNLGTMRNYGLEVAAHYGDRFGDFSFEIAGNFTKYWNKIMDMGPNNYAESGDWIYAEGYPVGSYYLILTDGLYSQEDIDSGNYTKVGSKVPQAGDIKYIDQNDDGQIDAEDRKVTKCDVANFEYGLSLDLGYRDFNLSIVGRGVTGISTLFSNEMAMAFYNKGNVREWQMKERWTEDNPNPNAGYPRLTTDTKEQALKSDYWLFSGNFFRVKNITLSYNVPKQLLSKYSIGGLRLFASLENPFTLRGDKRMKDYDPESGSGRAGSSYGVQTYTFGVNVSF